jgi:shikimate dehydrogenase
MPINSDTSLLALFGNPLGHSLSPVMHNATLERMKLNYLYLPFEIFPDKLEEAIKAIIALNIRGVNVTIPYKEKVIPYLDDLSEEAAACGAVNLISNDKGRLVGYNTDGKAFVAALLEEGVSISGQAVIIGAGGAARAVAYELARQGIRQLDFLDIDYERAAGLAEFIAGSTGCRSSAGIMNEKEFAALSRLADIIVNCSPVGMHPFTEESPLNRIDSVGKNTVLCDLIYNPLETRFLRLGRERGLKTINGLGMFVHQGALSLQILLNVSPPFDYMKEVVLYQLR